MHFSPPFQLTIHLLRPLTPYIRAQEEEKQRIHELASNDIVYHVVFLLSLSFSVEEILTRYMLR